jgi:hypothetical protein
MKSFFMPAMILCGAGVTLLIVALFSFQSTSIAQQQLLESKRNAQDADVMFLQSVAKSTEARKRGTATDVFLETWRKEFRASDNVEQVFGRLDTLAVNNLLSPSGKSFTVNSGYFFKDAQVRVKNVNVTVTGDYFRILNWLGAAEYAFPLSRVEQVSFTTNASSLALSVQFVFPNQFETQ